MAEIRKPAVAGQFYPGTKAALSKNVASLLKEGTKKEDAVGVISPHAGYIYSGQVAGAVFSSIKPKKTYIVMGPNHTGMGKPFSLSASDSWATPLGEVALDKELTGAIKRNSRYVKEDDSAHIYEHSVEVQLPFLQSLKREFKFVPLVISYAGLEVYREIGKALATAVKESGLKDECMIIASSDMTHYEAHEAAKKKDAKAIEAILELNEEKLVDYIEKFSISMCGYAPAAIMLVAAKELDAKAARLVKYATSGDASGDYSSVVGYAGVVVT